MSVISSRTIPSGGDAPGGAGGAATLAERLPLHGLKYPRPLRPTSEPRAASAKSRAPLAALLRGRGRVAEALAATFAVALGIATTLYVQGYSFGRSNQTL